jgi:flavodoxin I
MTIGLFYSTMSGATKQVAESIRMVFGGESIVIHDIDAVSADKLSEYDKLIFGAPTMGEGELSDEWDDWIDEIDPAHVKGKTVALYGLGDQEGYPDTFVDALGTIYDRLVKYGANLVGEWPTDGYDYESSEAEREGRFVGLVVDEDNQPDKTESRVREWVVSIMGAFEATAHVEASAD